MSLLMDARKKSQSAADGETGLAALELSLEDSPRAASKLDTQPLATSPDFSPGVSPGFSPGRPPDLGSRNAGKNLFDAKSAPRTSVRNGGINRNLLLALGGTLVLLAAGGGYVWYAISPTQPRYASSTPVARPNTIPAPAQNNDVAPVVSPRFVSPQFVSPQSVTANTAASGVIAAGISIADTAMPGGRVSGSRVTGTTLAGRPARITRVPNRVANSQAGINPAIQLEPKAESIDLLLNNAYQAYRSGNFEQAQQLYRRALNLDARNADALLGLAVIAQRRGFDQEAATYYARVLVLDPRDAVAQAGMSALSTDNNRESRLKILLNEQQNSASLHFALGNQYAEQSRWGEAQLAYFKAYYLQPDNAELVFNLAVSLDHLGKGASAAQYYQAALQLDTSHSAGFDHAKTTQRIQDLTR